MLVAVFYRWTFWGLLGYNLFFWWAKLIREVFSLKGLKLFFLFWKSKYLSSSSIDMFFMWDGPICFDRLFLNLLIRRDSSLSLVVEKLLRLRSSRMLLHWRSLYLPPSSLFNKFLEIPTLERLANTLGSLGLLLTFEEFYGYWVSDKFSKTLSRLYSINFLFSWYW